MTRQTSSTVSRNDTIRTTPLPEEIDRGYLGRVMRLNGIEKETEAMKVLREWTDYADSSTKRVPRVLLLAKAANMDTTTFVRRHSTLPLRRGITSYKTQVAHGCATDTSILWTSAMRQARRGVYCCEQCIEEDLSFHGFSYWRRDHQTPGLYWCPKHGTPLHFLDDDKAFFSAPSRCLDHAMYIQADWALRAQENTVVQRFLDICAYLMERPRPFAVKHVSSVLRSQARDAGFQVSGYGNKKPLLSDHVIDLVGRQWLGTVLQSVADKPKGELSTKLDGVLFLQRSASSVAAYVLAAATLFDSAEEAVNAWAKSQLSNDEQPSTKRRIDAATLVSTYVQARGSYRRTAELLSLDKNTTRLRLIKASLPNLEHRGNGDIKRALKAFFTDKRPLNESAALGNISTHTLLALVQVSGQHLCPILHAIDTPTGRGTGIPRGPQLTPLEASLHPFDD